MSTICDNLRAAILQAAMQGSLTDSDDESWNESKIEDVCELCTGNSISENVKKAKYMKVVEGRNYIGTKDLLFDHSFNYENGVKIPFDETNFRIANHGDILLCIEGGSAGRKIGILEEDVNYGNKLCRFSPNNKLSNRFLYFYIQSPLFQEQFSDSMTGIIGGVSIKKIKAITIKYPDIAEQKRIVEKVDELMARVADLEQSADALASLKKAFPDDIKASLLQAAMQGKLTKQLPEDGDAERLYNQIELEKHTITKNGKAIRWDSQPKIEENEQPYRIPDTWKWVRLGDIIHIESGNGLTSNQMKPGKIPVYGGNGITGYHNESFLHKETVVIGRVGFYCGSVHVTQKESWVTDNAFITTYPGNSIDREFLVYALRFMNLGQNNNATAQPVVSGKKIYPLPFPLPPLTEQKRIVERLDILMKNINAVGELIASE